MPSPLEKIGESRYHAGCEALTVQQLWMADLLQRGLAEAREQPPEFWEHRASRLVDDKLSGAARILRRIASLPPSRSDWADIVLSLLGDLQVLADAFLRLADLPEPLQHEVINRLGWHQTMKELVDAPGVTDDWIVLGSRRREEDHLILDASWLYGRESQRFALDLQFTPPHLQSRGVQPFPCGGCFRAEVVFHQGTAGHRVFLRSEREHSRESAFLPQSQADFSPMFDEFAAALAENPLANARPAFVQQVRVVKRRRQIFLQDKAGVELALDPEFASPWRMLAASGGQPASVFGEWNGLFFSPLSMISSRRLVNLDPQVL